MGHPAFRPRRKMEMVPLWGEGHEYYTCLPSVAPPFRCEFPSCVFFACSGFAGCRATWRRRWRRPLWRWGTFWRAFRRTFRRACFRTSLQRKPYGRPLPLAALWIGQALEGTSRLGCDGRYVVADVELHYRAKRNDTEGSVDAAVVSCEGAARVGRARAVGKLSARDASRAILRTVSSVCFVGMLLQRSESGLFLRTVFTAAVVRRFRLRVWLRRRLVRGGWFGGGSTDVGDDSQGMDQADMSGISQPENPPDEPSADENTAAANARAQADADAQDWDLGPDVFVLVLHNGSTQLAKSYWAADGYLEYISPDGIRSHIPLDALDLQSTVVRNERRGIPFVLRSTPAGNQ